MPDENAIPRKPDPDAEPDLILRLERRLGLLAPVHVVPFRSFGTPRLLRLRGRVIERKGVQNLTEESSTWQNVLNTLRRIESREIPGARVRARYQGGEWETTTDAEGYFVLDVHCAEPLEPGWHDVELELVESIGEPAERHAVARALVPRSDAEFAIVSDLDDTVIQTHSTDLLQEIAIVFGKGAHERLAFPGIPALYRALARGPDDRGENPLFYVSMSGWNLYDLFEEFMDANGIPIGPLFLSDLRLIEDPSPVMGSQNHKFESIDLLLRTYPELPFLLVGDSGMHDPELYRQIVEKHPGRIHAVVIHDVSASDRDDRVDEIMTALEERGVSAVRAADSLGAARFAREQGYISEKGLGEVRREVERSRERDG